MQAIQTKYIGPSNVRGSRVSAACQAKRIIVEWDDGLNSDDNHAAAARMLAQRLGWDKPPYGTLASGCLADGTHVHVFVK